ncbi:MAG TPA: zinc ribbon domain-containing protein [Actinomycetota bacterium]
MPLYEYSCDACGQRFEALVPAGDADDATCTACGAGPVRRLLSLIAAPVRGGDGAAAPAPMAGGGGGGCCGGACGHC